MTREEMTPEWVRKEIEEVFSWGQFTIAVDRRFYLSLLTSLEKAWKERDEARKEAEGWRDDWVREFAHNESERGLVTDQKDLRERWPCSWERPNPETPRGE